jgi:hypothetical protein
MNAQVENPFDDDHNEIAAEFLLGEMIHACAKQLREMKVPWNVMVEEDQRLHLERIRQNLQGSVMKAIRCIRSQNRTNFVAEVESVTFKDGVKAVLKMSKDLHAHELADVAGQAVLVVLENGSDYMGCAGSHMKTDPDNYSVFGDDHV